MANLHRFITLPGLDHDLAYLCGLQEGKAHKRIKAILSHLEPFASKGFPKFRTGSASLLIDWWDDHAAFLKWNPKADRYEMK